MNTLLELRTSIHSEQGASSRLAADFVSEWLAANSGATVLERDLSRDPVPHLTAERFAAFLAKPEARTPEQQAVAGFSDALIAELQAADMIVIGLPMYNFGIPSTLKAYFDHVARAGVTFRYGEKGPEGLLKGKKVVVFATRGGLYAGTLRDTQTAYLRDFLAFLGMDEVEIVYAEGLAMGEAPRKRALEGAALALRALANGRPAALPHAA